jgi:hypothetical protein
MTGDENRQRRSWLVAWATTRANRWQSRGVQPLEPDPYLGAKSAGRAIYTQVRGALDLEDPGLLAGSLLCALGAVAGHACQASVRARSVATGNGPDAPFRPIRGDDGKLYLSGDAMNGPLAKHKMSLWNLTTGAAQLHGSQPLPKLDEIVDGLSRLSEVHAVSGSPIEFARRLWPAAEKTVIRLTGEPKMWPIAAGLAVQEAIAATKDIVAPDGAVRIVMESAILVSRIPIER